MPESSLTLRRVFSLPESDVKDLSHDRWKILRERITKEVKGIKWTATMPDITQKVGELFDIEIPNILVASWKKAQALRTILDESKDAPEQTMYLELAEHTISSSHHPYIEIRIKDIPVKKIEFTVQLSFKLKGFILKIQEGLIKEIQTGTCEVEGAVQYEGLTLAEKNFEPIKLPGSIPVHESNDQGRDYQSTYR